MLDLFLSMERSIAPKLFADEQAKSQPLPGQGPRLLTADELRIVAGGPSIENDD